jgi:hypothetical protein
MSTDVRTPDLEVSAAFLAEVREQRAEALEEMERAAASLDEWALSAARGRLRDLEELLDRNDAGWQPRCRSRTA